MAKPKTTKQATSPGKPGKSKGTTLPARFVPFLNQAITEGKLRYGGQEAGLQSIFDATTHDYTQQGYAQDTANRSLLGALQQAPADLTRVYSDAGLTPQVLGTISNSPTGQRLAGELARSQAGIVNQRTGAQAGAVYQKQHLADNYREDVGKINSQAQALSTEKGLFQSSLLDQLIGSDRSARHDANIAAAKLQFDADQATLDRTNSTSNALIGAGIDPTTGATLPARAKAPGSGSGDKNKASQTTIKNATGAFSQIRTYANAIKNSKTHPSRHAAGAALLTGRKGSTGQKVYDPATGRPVLNKDGTQKTTSNKSEVPSYSKDQPLVQAALDMVYDGHISPATVKLLHKAYGNGIVGALPGIKTRKDVKKAPVAPRPALAPDGSGGFRPT